MDSVLNEKRQTIFNQHPEGLSDASADILVPVLEHLD